MNLETETLARMAWDQVWQVTALILVIAGITKCLGKRRPHLAYVLWMLVILKCLTPPLWSSPTGIFSWVERIGRAPAAANSATPAVVDSSNPGATDAGENATNPGWQEFAAEGSESANEPIDRRIGIAGGLLCLWLVGVVAIALIALVRTVRCMTNLRRWQCEPDDALMTALGELKARLGLRRQVRLIVSSQPLGPAVFGVLVPTIVLPKSLVASKSTVALKPILAHELVHVRRGDTLFALAQLCAGILWWFHPLVWWANRRMEAEREQSCDEETIAGLKLNQGSYAQSLLDVLKSRRQLRPFLVAPGVRALAVTTERLEHIMSLPETIHRRTPLAYWLMLAIGVAVLLPGRGPTATAGGDDKQGSAATGTVKSSAEKDKARRDDTSKKSSAQKRKDEREARLAKVEPEFKKIYRLEKNEVLRHIPEPLDRDLRMKWYNAIFGNNGSDDRIEIVTLYLQWKDERPQWKGATVGSSGGGMPIRVVLPMLNAVSSQYIEGEDALLDREILGDWVFDPKAPADAIVAALQPVLRKEWGLPVKLDFRYVERDVYVVRGKWEFEPISDDFPDVQIYGAYLAKESGSGGGTGKFDKFLTAVGSWIRMPIVNEVTEPPAKRIAWRYHMPSKTTRKQQEDSHNPEDVTKNLAEQTGLEFVKERRETRVLFVEQ